MADVAAANPPADPKQIHSDVMLFSRWSYDDIRVFFVSTFLSFFPRFYFMILFIFWFFRLLFGHRQCVWFMHYLYILNDEI